MDFKDSTLLTQGNNNKLLAINEDNSTPGRFSTHNIAKIFNVKDYGALGDNSQNDTAYIQSAINACRTAGGGIVYFPKGIYLIGGAIVTSENGVDPSSQLYIPPCAADLSDKTTITLLGESPTGFNVGYLASISPLATEGVILRSTISGSGTNPALLGTKGLGVFNFHTIKVENINFQVYSNSGVAAPSMHGINFRWASTYELTNVNISLDVPNQNSTDPSSAEFAAFIGGLVSRSAPNFIKGGSVGGFKYGYVLGEHTELFMCRAYVCTYGYVIPKGYYLVQGMCHTHGCVNSFLFPTANLFGYTNGFNEGYVDLLIETENYTNSVWWDTVAFVVDEGNYGFGKIVHQISTAGTGVYINTPTKVGGRNVLLMPTKTHKAQWTTATRPTAPIEGMEGYNLTTHVPEYWNGSTWV